MDSWVLNVHISVLNILASVQFTQALINVATVINNSKYFTVLLVVGIVATKIEKLFIIERQSERFIVVSAGNRQLYTYA